MPFFILAFPAETKKSSKRPKRLFHQLNDMIVVRRFQYVHQLDEIETINNDKKIRIIILIGQTGAGKTQSAYWVCRKAQSKYSVIVKLSASNRADFVTSLKNFAINLNLGLPHEEDDMKIIESISSTIVTYLNNVSKESGLKNMFLVLIDDVHVDNAVNDSETTLSKMVSKTILLLSEVNTLKLIITTTNPMLFDDCCLDYKEVIFVGMIPTECVSFLKRSEHFKEETNEDIENLIKNIGCLPITINSARKFMIQHKMHIKKYIKLYEKLKDADNENITEVVNCQKIPVEYIKNGLDGPSWEVITLLPYLDYNSIHQELVEACCHHICKDETKAEIIIGRFREYSLCQYDKIPRLRVFSTDDSQEDRIISFHSETMLTLKLIDKNHNNKKTTDRHKLFVLLKMFFFLNRS
ncbi:uncharacterized protein LOC127735704 [Mytilus californianus]|uniref:uncharacterized protein LOC127735704 n=1 Tax=Mytilus californianus TaxID=6549 RepID=UPI0022450AB2|nr:uncharacterized protein LOC127735704 [Mytilus californianus]